MTTTLEAPTTNRWVNPNVKGFEPSKLKRCANIYWRNGRRVRIMHDQFGYKGKIGVIGNVGPERVLVDVIISRKPYKTVPVKYVPEHLRLI